MSEPEEVANPQPVDRFRSATPITEVLDALGRNRPLLILVYVVLLVAFTTASVRVTPFLAGAEGIRWLIPGQESFADEPDEEDQVLSWVAGTLGFLLALQALFLWGGGRITVSPQPARPWKLVVPLLIASAILTILLVGLGMTVLDMFDRLGSEGTQRPDALFEFDEEVELPFVILLLMTWALWFVIGFVALRGHDQSSRLGRLSAVLVAGSWIEFLVALPVDIAVRRRSEDCPCGTGSWLALTIGIPLILFSFGPGLYLLYLRDFRLGRRRPFRALAVLARKSRLEKDPS